jgi:hypothetical protein
MSSGADRSTMKSGHGDDAAGDRPG